MLQLFVPRVLTFSSHLKKKHTKCTHVHCSTVRDSFTTGSNTTESACCPHGRSTVIHVHAMKLEPQSFLTSVRGGGDSSASRYSRFTLRYTLDRRLLGTQSRFGELGEEKSPLPLPAIELRFLLCPITVRLTYPGLRFSRGFFLKYSILEQWNCRSQWPRGLERGSAATRLLGLWVRIPPGAWMFVSCEWCVLSGRGLCDGPITRPEESHRLWWVVVCDLAHELGSVNPLAPEFSLKFYLKCEYYRNQKR